jgi:hypothetical protein
MRVKVEFRICEASDLLAESAIKLLGIGPDAHVRIRVHRVASYGDRFGRSVTVGVRADDSFMPAARFFRRGFPDFFETVLWNIDDVPRPRKRNQAMALSG